MKKDEVPMGVSVWRNHGKKWGYWEYFKDEVIEEIQSKSKPVMSKTFPNFVVEWRIPKEVFEKLKSTK